MTAKHYYSSSYLFFLLVMSRLNLLEPTTCYENPKRCKGLKTELSKDNELLSDRNLDRKVNFFTAVMLFGDNHCHILGPLLGVGTERS